MRGLLAQTGAVARREWQLAFSAPTATVFLAAFGLASALLAIEVGGLLDVGLAELTTWFQFLPWLFCVFVPALTMSAWAGERREGSLEQLLSLPLPLSALIVGKFLTYWALVCLGLLVVLPLWLMVGLLGPVDHGATLATLIGAILIAGVMVAVCLAVGARASNQIVAFVASALVCVMLTAAGLPVVEGVLSGLAGAPVAQAARGLTVLSQFEGLQRGVIEGATLVYCAALITVSLAITASLLPSAAGQRGGTSWRDRLLRYYQPILITGLIASFLGTALVARLVLPGVRVDATQGQLFTLSQTTKQTLRTLQTPLDATLFVPAPHAGVDPALVSYAGRVQDLLATYARNAGGRFQLDVQQVTPFSQAEDLALEAGLSPLESSTGGAPTWFGLRLVNGIDQMVTLPFLDPAQEGRLEYDVTAALSRLQQETPPLITVLTDLPWFYEASSSSPTGRPVAPVAQALSERYPVAVLASDFNVIPPETAVLIIAQPNELTPWQSWLVDQYAMRNGKIIMALDPALSAGRDVGGRMARGAVMADVLAGWGITLSDTAIADRQNALPVQANIEGRTLVVPHPFYYAVPKSSLSLNDPVTAGLSAGIHFATAGAVGLVAGSPLTLSPLATTSDQSRAFPATFAVSGVGPDQVLADWPSSDGAAVIGAKITGTLPSALAGQAPPPAPAGAPALAGPDLRQSARPVSLYVFGDADFLYDGLYGGETGAVADNETLFLNAVDALAGGVDLSAIRSRPIRARRLEVIDRLRTESQGQLLEEQRALETRVETLNRQLSQAATGNDASLAQAGFRRELVAARQRLRVLQTSTTRQIGLIRNGMLAVCAGLVPLLWVLLGLGLYRHRQRQATKALRLGQ